MYRLRGSKAFSDYPHSTQFAAGVGADWSRIGRYLRWHFLLWSGGHGARGGRVGIWLRPPANGGEQAKSGGYDPKSAVTGGGPEMGVTFSALIFHRNEQAIDAMGRMMDHRFPLVPFLVHLEMIDPLWKHDRFARMVEQLRLPPAAFEYRKNLQ